MVALHSLKIGLVALCHATIQEKYACESSTSHRQCTISLVAFHFPESCPPVIFDLMSSGRDQISFSNMKLIIQDLLQVLNPQKNLLMFDAIFVYLVTTQCWRRWSIFCACCRRYSKQLLELCKHKMLTCGIWVTLSMG